MVDISKDFTRSEHLATQDRNAVPVPGYIRLTHVNKWPGYIATDHKLNTFEDAGGETNAPSADVAGLSKSHGLLLYLPLYGSRDAPNRWRLRGSRELRRAGFAQFRLDCCVFADLTIAF